MLYTARPLERIYGIPPAFAEVKQGTTSQDKSDLSSLIYKEVPLPNGRLLTRREGENYIIERIHSTDMKDYLNESYFPGQNYKVE